MKNKKEFNSSNSTNWINCNGGNWGDSSNWDNGVPTSSMSANFLGSNCPAAQYVSVLIDDVYPVGQINVIGGATPFYFNVPPSHGTFGLTVYDAISCDSLIMQNAAQNAINIFLPNTKVVIKVGELFDISEGFIVGEGSESSLDIQGAATSTINVLSFSNILSIELSGNCTLNVSGAYQVNSLQNVGSFTSGLDTNLVIGLSSSGVQNQLGNLTCMGNLGLSGGGVLPISGNLVFSSETVWNAALGQGLISAKGTATLASATFSVSGCPASSGSQTMVTAEQGIEGEFTMDIIGGCEATPSYETNTFSMSWVGFAPTD